jgi:membrane protein
MSSERRWLLLPGFLEPIAKRVRSFVRLLGLAWKEYEHDYARFLAGATVYSALVSLIPLLLLAVAGLGLLLRFSDWAAEAQRQVLAGAESRFGADVRATVEELLGALKQESVIATVVSLVTLFFTASGLFRQLRASFRALWNVPPPVVSGSIWVVARTIILEHLVSFAMVAAGGLLLLAALALVAANQWLSDYLDSLPLISVWLAWFLSALSPLTIAAVTFALLYKYLPPVPVEWQHVWPAAALCAVVWVLAGYLLSLYGAFFGNNVSASGAFAGLLVIMLWLNTIGQLLFYGAELCKVLARDAPAQPAQAVSPPPISPPV